MEPIQDHLTVLRLGFVTVCTACYLKGKCTCCHATYFDSVLSNLGTLLINGPGTAGVGTYTFSGTTNVQVINQTMSANTVFNNPWNVANVAISAGPVTLSSSATFSTYQFSLTGNQAQLSLKGTLNVKSSFEWSGVDASFNGSVSSYDISKIHVNRDE